MSVDSPSLTYGCMSVCPLGSQKKKTPKKQLIFAENKYVLFFENI